MEIHHLWNREYPANLQHATLADLESYLAGLTEPSHLLLLDAQQQLKGWYVDFMRENGRWFALIIDSALHGQGFGSQLLDIARQQRTELNGWVVDHARDHKINGEPYRSPLGFYLKNGFIVRSEERLELEKISAVKIHWNRPLAPDWTDPAG